MSLRFDRASSKLLLRDTMIDVAASLFMAAGIKIFSAPNQIAPGGVNGIATLINYLTGLPIGTMGLLFNIPLLLLAYRKLGSRFTLRTLRTIVIYSLATDLVFANPPTYTGDSMLAALFAGVFVGVGGGMVFMHGSTSGGSDIITKLVQKKRPYLSTGQLVMAINGVVMVAAAVVYRNIEAALYGLIMTFATGKIMDSILYGADTGKCCMIITSKPKEISQHIIQDLHRSATILDGTGAYKQNETWMLLCVVRKQEFYSLKKLIRAVDPMAFVIVSEAHQIIGQGFKAIDAADS